MVGLSDDEPTIALRRHQQTAMVLSAVKGAANGGIGKTKENPTGPPPPRRRRVRAGAEAPDLVPGRFDSFSVHVIGELVE